MRQGPVAQSTARTTRPRAHGGDASDPTVAAEYDALTTGVALVDRSDLGRLRLTGEDALDLLQRLSTNDLESLQPGMGAATVLTSNKGRIVDLLVVLSLPEDDSLTPALSRDGERGRRGLLVLTAPHNRGRVAEWIDFYTFTEDVKVEDVTGETAALSVVGPEAASVIARDTGGNPASMDRYSSVQARVFGVDALMVRTDFAGVPAFDLIVASPDATRLRQGLLEQGDKDGITAAGAEAVEAVGIEHGVPASGKELTEDFNPLEAGLLEFISFSKGCYVGQEVVTRLNTYHKVSKHLVGLRWGPDASVTQGAKLFQDGKQVGAVTSAAVWHRADGCMGLGYVSKAQAEDGAALSLEADGGEASIEVVGLNR